MLKQKSILLLMIAVVYISVISCDKGCFRMALGELNCDPGFIPVTDTEYRGDRHLSWSHDKDEVIVINDIEAYKQSFPWGPDSMPLGIIDFNKSSLIGVEIDIDAGNELDHQGCLCFDPETNKWLFKIEYTLSQQCKGSKIYSSWLVCTIICPKLPADAIVELKARNINPL